MELNEIFINKSSNEKELKYKFNELEPFFSENTVRIHFENHYKEHEEQSNSEFNSIDKEL